MNDYWVDCGLAVGLCYFEKLEEYLIYSLIYDLFEDENYDRKYWNKFCLWKNFHSLGRELLKLSQFWYIDNFEGYGTC